MQFLLIKESGL